MKFAIVLAAICFLGVAFAAPAPDAAAKPNAFADWQKAFQETLNNLLGQNKDKPKRELTWADLDGLKELKGYKGKRDLTGDIMTAVMNMNNPIVLAQTMFKIMNQLNNMGQNKTADASAPAAGNLAGDAIALLTKANDPMAFAGQLFKVVNTLAKDNKVVIPAGAAKPKFNFLKNPTLKNPNWNKKPATETEAVAVEEAAEEAVEEAIETSTEAQVEAVEKVVEEVAEEVVEAKAEAVEEVVEDSTEAAIERVARQERLPEWEPDFKDQMKANAYGIIGIGNLLEYLDERKAKKAAAAKAAEKAKRDLFKKTPTGWKKVSDLNAVEEVVEDATEAKAEAVAVEEVVEELTEATRVAREAESAPADAAPAPAGQFSLKDFGKMVDDFYAQFRAPKKSA